MGGKPMYKSPIEIVCRDLDAQLEGEVMRVIREVGVVVDKEELLRALKYDREQYEKGWDDALRENVVRCKECKYSHKTGRVGYLFCNTILGVGMVVVDDDFCSHGERRNDV
jgi:hypothetical protein